ncbi:hypothetical protein [Roseimicrobium sp. ORNL1]|uniref:hypothetical protein n=1 Tax=Roseimicrobium sp. ORNL1 TaxID=2711231 RepID=UPI0013E152FB|nr:hypothetical protein [Roseimicrobium sp. ORNL1]QIF04315.1 hypothetical protein G5S37_23255 [Roseimicrobium sp. ORNL1]
MNSKIIQLVTPGAPVLAVFNIRNDDGTPRSMDDLLLLPIPVLALVERPNGEQAVVGMEAHSMDEFAEVECRNFLGYCHSEESAVEIYARPEPTPTAPKAAAQSQGS